MYIKIWLLLLNIVKENDIVSDVCFNECSIMLWYSVLLRLVNCMCLFVFYRCMNKKKKKKKLCCLPCLEQKAHYVCSYHDWLMRAWTLNKEFTKFLLMVLLCWDIICCHGGICHLNLGGAQLGGVPPGEPPLFNLMHGGGPCSSDGLPRQKCGVFHC